MMIPQHTGTASCIRWVTWERCYHTALGLVEMNICNLYDAYKSESMEDRVYVETLFRKLFLIVPSLCIGLSL